MFECGVPKGGGAVGRLAGEKKVQSFKFVCLKWPILAGMTAKSGNKSSGWHEHQCQEY